MTAELAPARAPHWVEIVGGTFCAGSDDFYLDEAPVRSAQVADFIIGATPVTNRQFAAFVTATGYVTVAEQPLSGSQFSTISRAERAPGSLVFTKTDGPVDLQDWRQWWRWVPGANWQWPRGHDQGPNAATHLSEHPVVQVAYADALAYAEWVGGRLPTETELEYAACGGQRPRPYAWGATRDLNGHLMANTWRGTFPYRNTGANGWIGTSPVGTFPANGYGLFDCIGNVWEWTSSQYGSAPAATGCKCSPTSQPHRFRPAAEPAITQRVLKGGSHLCAPEYCLRYRPAARSPQAEDSATTHIGFRIAKDAVRAA
jgi:sulfatase modifying factor 1